MSTIELKNLYKTFKNVTAVNKISLSVGEGELFSLLGINGAGKTTVIRILSCLTKPTSGDAFVCGHSVVDEQDKVKSVIAVSPQETAVAPNLTVAQNLRFMAEIYGADIAQSRKTAQDIIEKMKLGEVVSKRAKTLSGGWQRRLSIAMALIASPKVLFLDEPTLGLDVIARRELWELIKTLKGNTTIILTTHYLEEAEAVSDRVGIMANGRLLAVGTPTELINKAHTATFEDAFVKIATEGKEQ
jgi:ABC-2 type transport system ATP-binding protein